MTLSSNPPLSLYKPKAHIVSPNGYIPSQTTRVKKEFIDVVIGQTRPLKRSEENKKEKRKNAKKKKRMRTFGYMEAQYKHGVDHIILPLSLLLNGLVSPRWH